MRYRVVHRTTYRYSGEVTDSLGVAHLLPREAPGQRVGAWRVEVHPGPVELAEEADLLGNRVTHFQVTVPHRELAVVGEGEVEVEAAPVAPERLAVPWEELRPLVHPRHPGAWAAAELALSSPSVPAHAAGVALLAAPALTAGRPVGEAVLDLVHRVHAGLAYDPTATTVTSPVAEVVARGAGVCQDFAHVVLAALRDAGLAARYVSGYLSTDPPPGRDRVVGADASHAWVAVWLGDDTWLAVDPTNDAVVTDRHVTVAWGRDYGDVPPVKGVIFTDDAVTSELEVSVDVAPVTAGTAGGARGATG